MDLTVEARKARNAYFKKWRESNKGKVREAQARYWEKKARKAEESK